jgi:hypothetical protein
MRTCKNCNKEIDRMSLSQFCSSDCVIEHQEKKSDKRYKNKLSKPISDVPIHFQLIGKTIKNKKAYFIHNKTLDGYVNLKAFEDFLLNNRLMVVRLEDKEFDLSVIKPSIL